MLDDQGPWDFCSPLASAQVWHHRQRKEHLVHVVELPGFDLHEPGLGFLAWAACFDLHELCKDEDMVAHVCLVHLPAGSVAVKRPHPFHNGTAGTSFLFHNGWPIGFAKLDFEYGVIAIVVFVSIY